MKKLSGHICDNCRTMFYPGDTIVELCEKCAITVWCVFNKYEDGQIQLTSIHRSKQSAENFMNKNAEYHKARYTETIEQILEEHILLDYMYDISDNYSDCYIFNIYNCFISNARITKITINDLLLT